MKKNPVIFKKTLVVGIIILLIVTVFSTLSGSINIDNDYESMFIDTRPDLECDGEIVIKRTDPGSTVIGSFIIRNIGDSGSQLDWEVTEYPDFGTDWIINPSNGKDLTPEEGKITIEVQFIAPSPEIPSYYGGVIKVCSVDNPDDIDLIAVNINVGRNRGKIEHFILGNDYPSFVRILAIFNKSDIVEMDFNVTHEFKIIFGLLGWSYKGIYKDIRLVVNSFKALRLFKFPYCLWDSLIIDSYDDEFVELRVDKFIGLFSYYYEYPEELTHLNGYASGVEITYPI